MKTLLITLLTMSLAFAGSDFYANHLKENYPDAYANTIRKYAIQKWGDDYTMVKYAITRQADSINNIIKSFSPDDTTILYKAIIKWSRGGMIKHNVKTFKEIDSISYGNLLKMHCDWTMVDYQYKRQVAAKYSF